MVRDNIKDENYFKEFLKTKNELISLNEASIMSGEMSKIKIERAYFRNVGFNIESVIAQYSMGAAISELKDSIKNIISLMPNYWSPKCTKVENTKGEIFDIYLLNHYETFLHVLSLAYRLEVPDKDFKVLVDIIDRDNISDKLYEFIIKARFSDSKLKRVENIKIKKETIKVYDKLRTSTETEDKLDASKLVKEFLEKSFYHKHMNLYNSHNNYSLYCGYWSFEAAAVVKIMNLDDSSFIDNQYYPKDLVHQKPEPPKKKGFLGKLGF